MSVSGLNQALLSGERPATTDAAWSPPERRLLNIVASQNHAPSPIEFAILLRQCLRYEDERLGGTSYLRLSKTKSPEIDVLKATGLAVIAQPDDILSVSARPWTPAWLDTTDLPPFAAAFSEVQRRQIRPVPGDPFLSLMNYDEYLSPAQRTAVRATLSAPAGSTLLVSLPTGAGKSACAQLLGLFERQGRGKVTIVVVPTDALNVDQERQIKSFIGYDCAYRGASSEAAKRDICRRVFLGEQRLLFATPEAIVGRLRSPLMAAAQRGDLGAIVVDEAHMVDAWGDAFRPTFQELPGLRRELLRKCPQDRRFVTVLLSATLTPSCVRLLEELFPPALAAPLRRVFALGLRPEPSYWFSKCRTQEERTHRLAEALRHAPRPAIVYSSLKKEKVNQHGRVWGTSEYIRYLKSVGYRRIAAFTGDTPDSRRREIIDDWAADRLDLVVATSAFGLGVDKQNVRAVFHVCLPESIDRFYQEVGRGGRDGKASVSVVLSTQADMPVASTLSGQKNITVKKGFERWKDMYRNRDRDTTLGPGRYRVNIDTVPSYKAVGTTSGRRNRQWNVRTLLLMARAGLLEFDAEEPPALPSLPKQTVTPEETEQILAERAAAFEEFASRRVVKVIDERHLDWPIWETIVEEARATGAEERKQFRDAVAGRKSVHLQLETTYEDRERGVYVARACGGEPGRRSDASMFCEPERIDMAAWPEQVEVGPQLTSLLGENRLLVGEYAAGSRRKLRRLVKWLVGQRIANMMYEEDAELEANSAGRSPARDWQSAVCGSRYHSVYSGISPPVGDSTHADGSDLRT